MKRAVLGTLVAFLLPFVLLGISAPVNATVPAADFANGSAFQVLPCWPAGTDYYDPETHAGHCQGTATWQGDWTGQTTFDAVGTLDIVTGDASGTIKQDFDGYHLREGSTNVANAPRGQMHFSGTFKVDGATGAETVRLTITKGTGDFAGATGTATFIGFAPISTGPATATYTARWWHPKYI